MRSHLAFVVLALLTACSAKKPDTSLDTAEGFCAQWASRACSDKVWQACGATGADTCIAAQQTFCETLVPTGKYSSTHAKECLNAVAAAYKDASLSADERDTVLRLENDCELVLSGPGGEHSKCTEDSDCNRNDGLSCVRKSTAAGQCEKPVTVSGGYPCSAPNALCDKGFYCDGANCIATAPGNACSPSIPCVATAHCALGDGGAGVCVARQDQGKDCKSDDDCLSRICSIAAGASSGKCLDSAPPLSATDQICANLQ
jgi:hypothetical protein